MDVVRGLALAVAVAAAGATGASGQSTPDGQALYRERCASCHGASLV